MNAKREILLKTGKNLFWKFGITRVTIEEICREAGISKMTFYKHFSNKNELAIHIISQIFDESTLAFQRLLAQDIPYEQKMEQQIQLKLQSTQDISQEFVKDVYSSKHPEIHAYWEKRAGDAVQMVIEHYKEAQEKGWLRKDIRIEFILYVINKMFEFVNDEKLVSQYDNMQDLIMEVNKFFLYGILPHNKQS